ncbi:hypothetical protein SH1V18_43190 [Vallitalea longa]|uniref:DUF4097 domain-containing protein n=1 Tax=Vallitalea longa TaxID=2936439 RepID=A0A9W5YH51_9FIRM|nr:DUF4097 family beta strand repeat-containing protein [Vallitalea longa]GKX31839.1 hypothetical protein SH1V18_43190 [Vallitalea longa]
MKHKKLGTLTLALTLIVLGIILLINNFVPIDIYKTLRILVAISIILIGVEFIFFDWYYKKRNSAMELKVSVSSIILLIIIYSVCFLFTNIKINLNNEESGNIFRRLFEMTDQYQITKSYVENADNLETISIDSNGGDIKVSATERKDINIEAVIHVNTYGSEEEAEELTDNMIDIDRKEENILQINSNNKMYNHRQIYSYVDYTIEIPKELQVSISNKNGNVYVYDVNGKTVISSRNSDIEVENIGDELYIENKYGDIEVCNVSGVTEIKNENGVVDIEKIGSDLIIKNCYDKIEFEDIMGNVTIEQKNGEIDGNSVNKDLEIDAEYSPVKIEDIKGSVNIETTNNEVIVKNVDNNLELSNKYGAMTLEKIRGNISIYSTNGDINLDNHDIQVKEIDIEHKYGRVNIDIPNDQQGQFKLKTRYGNINSIIDMEIDEEDNEQSVNSIIGDNNSLIDITTNNGDIEIE